MRDRGAKKRREPLGHDSASPAWPARRIGTSRSKPNIPVCVRQSRYDPAYKPTVGSELKLEVCSEEAAKSDGKLAKSHGVTQLWNVNGAR